MPRSESKWNMFKEERREKKEKKKKKKRNSATDLKIITRRKVLEFDCEFPFLAADIGDLEGLVTGLIIPDLAPIDDRGFNSQILGTKPGQTRYRMMKPVKTANGEQVIKILARDHRGSEGQVAGILKFVMKFVMKSVVIGGVI